MHSALYALSPLDGRYQNQTHELSDFFSEAALMKFRSHVEVEWMIFMAEQGLIPQCTFNDTIIQGLRAIIANFSADDAQAVKNIEKTTNHDVKAIEYFLKERAQDILPKSAESFWHFGCTSEDINNLAYALMIKTALEKTLAPTLDTLHDLIQTKAGEYAVIPMLSHTHGQPASPTTLGKELANFGYRLKRQFQQLKQQAFLGKFQGAVGNFNAQATACPAQDWPKLAAAFISHLGLTYNPMVTQIEPHDFIAELCHNFMRINTILLDFARDLWAYISLDYFKLKVIKDEVGSSTMPHKVNPIDFENAEGNLGLANALFAHFAEKLPVSRLQRDLSDSTVLRNIGSAFAYALIAYRALIKGLHKISPNPAKIAADLSDRYEVLTEAIQTILRYHGVTDAYEQIKAASRGAVFDQAAYLHCIDKLELPAAVKNQLKALTPQNYTGYAARLTQDYA